MRLSGGMRMEFSLLNGVKVAATYEAGWRRFMRISGGGDENSQLTRCRELALTYNRQQSAKSGLC